MNPENTKLSERRQVFLNGQMLSSKKSTQRQKGEEGRETAEG